MLLPTEERVALATDLYLQRWPSRPNSESIATGTSDFGVVIILGVYFRFHAATQSTS